MKRVVVKGLDAITPLGNNIDEFWKNIVEEKSGAAPLTKFDSTKFKMQLGCEVKDFHPEEFLDRKELHSYDLLNISTMKLTVSNLAAILRANYVLNNTFGFGGHTASSIFKKRQ